MLWLDVIVVSLMIDFGRVFVSIVRFIQRYGPEFGRSITHTHNTVEISFLLAAPAPI
jgi:hypothetical protein